ncbi:MAG: hypothetical protein ACI9Y1_003569 [Lentisphaeria bacterium]|jgi:uncharacterized protein YlxP (DUF503 family)
MIIGLLTIHLYLPGCASLKEKRYRVSGWRDRFGHTKTIAVCESDRADAWQHSQFSFVSIAREKKQVESSLAKIVDHCRSCIDAQLTHHHTEWL